MVTLSKDCLLLLHAMCPVMPKFLETYLWRLLKSSWTRRQPWRRSLEIPHKVLAKGQNWTERRSLSKAGNATVILRHHAVSLQ